MSAAGGAKKLPFTVHKCIKRSNTDLLKALAGTVGLDKTAPHYAFIDDPALIPTTDRAKQERLLARESGKQAARQLAVEWPTLFMFDRDEPRLEAFRPTELPPPSSYIIEASEEQDDQQDEKKDKGRGKKPSEKEEKIKKKNNFYSEYLDAKIYYASIDNLERLYFDLVPRVVSLSRRLLMRMLNRLEREELRWTLLRRLIEDAISAQYLFHEETTQAIHHALEGVNYNALSVTQQVEYTQVQQRLKDFTKGVSDLYDWRTERREQAYAKKEEERELAEQAKKAEKADSEQVAEDAATPSSDK